MTPRASLRRDFFEYAGHHLQNTSRIAEAEIEASFPTAGEWFRTHVHLVLGELTHNAAQHSPEGHKEARLTVDRDAIGTFVEVVSVSEAEKAEIVRDRIERHRHMSDAEVAAIETATFRRNLGTGQSGVGLYQVIRSALQSDMGRLISVNIAPLDVEGLVELRVRAYVSFETCEGS